MNGRTRRLLLLRHAKAESAGKGGGGDHERALSDRGRTDASEVGRLIAGRGEPIDLVLCSTSERTRQTWELVKAALPTSPEVRYLRQIYTAEDTYLEILASESGGSSAVLLVGHNPTIHETARVLDPDFASSFPTAALAIFTSEEDWTDLDQGRARCVDFLAPRGAASD